VSGYHPHLAGYDTVGFGFGNILHALNPVNVVKTAAQMAAMPVQMAYGLGKNIVQTPFKLIGGETRALQNLFGSGGGGSAPPGAPPGYPPGYMPPGAYTSSGWGQPPQPPPGYPPQPPPGYPPQPPPGYGMPPMAPPTQPMYDPNQYLAQTAPPPMDAMSLYGPNTGWDASYGGGQGAGW
jgi:hypothetical protein